MTINGALSDLNNLLKADDIPCNYKPSIKAVIDTISLSSRESSTVTPQEPRWIPVKTINQCYIPELKNYYGIVIATYLTGKHVKPQVTTISISYGHIENKKYTDIVAIMYLPKPYREVEE